MKVIKSKKQHELALQIVANYRIGKDAICRAIIGDPMIPEQMMDALEHLTSNTVSLLTAIVGVDGLKYYSNEYGLGNGISIEDWLQTL